MIAFIYSAIYSIFFLSDEAPKKDLFVKSIYPYHLSISNWSQSSTQPYILFGHIHLLSYIFYLIAYVSNYHIFGHSQLTVTLLSISTWSLIFIYSDIYFYLVTFIYPGIYLYLVTLYLFLLSHSYSSARLSIFTWSHSSTQIAASV